MSIHHGVLWKLSLECRTGSMEGTIASVTEETPGSLSFSIFLGSIEAIRNALPPTMRSRMNMWVQGLDPQYAIDMTNPVYFSWLLSEEYSPRPLANSLTLLVAPWNLMSLVERRYLQAWLSILDDTRRTFEGRQEPAVFNPEEPCCSKTFQRVWLFLTDFECSVQWGAIRNWLRTLDL